MLRSLRVIAVVVLCVGCSHKETNDRHIVAHANDLGEIYGQFLVDWTGHRKNPINVSLKAEAPSSKDIEAFSECAHDGRSAYPQLLPVMSLDDLTSSIGRLANVRLVDPDKWQPHDPGELIAQGQSVESAVETGFAHGLLRMSAIAFDLFHKTAAFTYSFECGALCGSGATVIFRKTPNGWIQSEKQCDFWIS
jgi:hypothetical protein